MRAHSLFFVLVCSLCTSFVSRGEMIPPLDIPLYMSASFAELRPNHFHSGIDLKTQGRTGLPVKAMDDGYVSRIVVSPWGFGRAVYIDHPSGLTTVYGHLERFAPFIDEVVRRRQYEQEGFSIECEFSAGELVVAQGDIIGYSGNAGSSGGPHLHLDIRDTETQDPLDPQPWFSSRVADDVAPDIRQLVFYHHNGRLNGDARREFRRVTKDASGAYSIEKPLIAWGDVSFGIEAYDRMTGTSNKYGVHQVELYIDDELFFSTVTDRFSFDETRYINSYTEGVPGGRVMRTYVAPGNRLRSIYKKVENGGVLKVDEERTYRCRYVLTDYAGNSSTIKFSVAGLLQEPVAPRKAGVYFSYAVDNSYSKDDFSLSIPAGALYDDLDFTWRKDASGKYCSDIHTIGPEVVSLHCDAKMSLRLTDDRCADKRKYYMVRIKGERTYPVAGEYDNGWYRAGMRDFGSYAVAIDTVPPAIVPLTPEKWGAQGKAVLKITDKGCGIESYRGEIDGQYVMFELDGKSDCITYRFESDRVKKGGKHTLRVTCVDMCGNRQEYTRSFVW